MSKNKKDNLVFTYNPDNDMPKHFFDKKGSFVGNSNKNNDGFIRIQKDSKSRGGKTVTLIWGFDETVNINELCSELKQKSATGGSVKESKIEIQGDKMDLIEKHLISKLYKVKRVGG